jgi:hypothetical protein
MRGTVVHTPVSIAAPAALCNRSAAGRLLDREDVRRGTESHREAGRASRDASLASRMAAIVVL